MRFGTCLIVCCAGVAIHLAVSETNLPLLGQEASQFTLAGALEAIVAGTDFGPPSGFGTPESEFPFDSPPADGRAPLPRRLPADAPSADFDFPSPDTEVTPDRQPQQE